MAQIIQDVSVLSNSHRARHLEEYEFAARTRRVYDQFAAPIASDSRILQHATSVSVPFLSNMAIATANISEANDVTPQTLRDTVVYVSPVSRAAAIQDSELQVLQNYNDYASVRFGIVAEALIEATEAEAVKIGLGGNLVIRAAARASLDAGTAGNTFTEAEFDKASVMLMALRCPSFGNPYPGGGGGNTWGALMSPENYRDLKAGTNLVSIAQYQDGSILLNNEKGMIGSFRIMVSPFAKVHGGAGADAASNSATTLSSAANALATTVVVASATNLSTGRMFTIGTEETSTLTDAGTFYPMNERVRYISESSTTVTIVGSGPNGGLRYDHASGVAVRNADSVYPVLFGGPQSLAKVYAVDVGEFGAVVGPNRQGLVETFISLGYKWYGGYGIVSESWLVRGEYSSTLDA